jgi:ATP synthase I chain
MTGEFYERALARAARMAAVLGALGTVAILVARGPRPAAGFLAGALISLLNFRWWTRLAGALGDTGKAPMRGSAVFLALRYLLAAGAIYVIVKILETALAAVLAGLFVSVAAVILEILYELMYART